MEGADWRNSGFNRMNAYYLGELANMAYLSPLQIQSKLAELGLSEFHFIDIAETQAFITGNHHALFLVFRGTDHPRDWMTNWAIDLVSGPVGRVHEGFHYALDRVWWEILYYLDEQRCGRELWITGHSLGGALATLAAVRLLLQRRQQVSGVYTFGQPRVGDDEFANNFNRGLGKQTFRYVNNNDFVPRFPFRFLDYSHVGEMRYFDAQGLENSDVSFWEALKDKFEGTIDAILESDLDGLRDHSVGNYLQCLRRSLSIDSIF